MSETASSDDVSKLRAMAREFTLGFNTRDVDRIMQFYLDRYVDVNLRNPVQTWAERREYYRRAMDRLNAEIDVQPDDILIEDGFAFVRGTIKLIREATESKATTTQELRYLEIARKQPDGSWKVLWGMDGPVQEYDPNQ